MRLSMASVRLRLVADPPEPVMAAGATATMDRRVVLAQERHHDTNQSASHREHEAFRQHLADESCAPRPDGQANRDLALTAG